MFKPKLIQFKIRKNRTDYMILVLIIILVVFGVIMVHSASKVSAELSYGDSFFFTKKQIIGAVIGFISLIILSFVDYHLLEKFKWPILIVSIVLLGLVFVPKIGVENYGAKRWLNLGITTIQPSEIAKFAFIIFSASVLAKNYNKVKTFRGILPVAIFGAIICLLIILEPNMSITMCVGQLWFLC